MPTLILVDPGQTEYSGLCDDCVSEKTGWQGRTEPHWLTEEALAEVRIGGEVPLAVDAASGECRRGHTYRVVRESEGTRH